MYRFSERSLKRMRGVDPRLIAIAKLAIKITVVDFGIPEYGGYRATEDQLELHRLGASPTCDGINTKSYHQSGLALDFYAIDPVTGRASWSVELLALVACAFLQAAVELGYVLEWGGLWGNGPYHKGFTDMPHVEIKNE